MGLWADLNNNFSPTPRPLGADGLSWSRHRLQTIHPYVWVRDSTKSGKISMPHITVRQLLNNSWGRTFVQVGLRTQSLRIILFDFSKENQQTPGDVGSCPSCCCCWRCLCYCCFRQCSCNIWGLKVLFMFSTRQYRNCAPLGAKSPWL